MSASNNGDTSPSRQLRIEALRIHKELIDRFSPEETREIIRHLTMIEAVLTRDGDEPPVTVIEPSS